MFIGNKNITKNIYRIQACYWIMYEYFWKWFIDFMLKNKSLLDYTNANYAIISPNEYEKNDKTKLKYFQ